MVDQVCRSIESIRHYHFTIISLASCFKSNKKSKSSLCSQTYSWNKDGLKLFLFQEYKQ